MRKIRIIPFTATVSLSMVLMLSGCSLSTPVTTNTTDLTTQAVEISLPEVTTSLMPDSEETAPVTTIPEVTAVVATAAGVTNFLDLNTDKVSLVALGNSDVPVGQYSEEILTSLGIWDAIQTKISYCGTVKEVLAQVAEGSVDCGIVYATDAASEPSVSIVMTAPGDCLKTPVVYPAATLSASKNPEAANAFLNFLLTDEAKAVFEDVGFSYIAESEAIEISSVPACTLTVFAAASMTESLTEIGDLFMSKYPGVELVMNFDSSGTLLTQIESGSEADIFLSAAQKQMTALIADGYITEGSKIDLLKNEVVLIVPAT